MASPPIDRMDKAQRRRLMATLLASAIADGKLDAGAVDFAALLFGDPDLWTEFQRHGAMVEDVIATSLPPLTPTNDKLVGKALPTSMKKIENDIVRALGIETAQRREGKGKDGDDTEYRRLRAKLKNYARYLAERADYERLNRSLQDAYVRPAMDTTGVGDLAKEFSLPLTDVALCLQEVQALLEVCAAPEGVDPRSLVPLTKKGTARKKLVLIDTAGRPRWGRCKTGRARPVVREPALETTAPLATQRLPEPEPIRPLQADRKADAPMPPDGLVLRARVGLTQDVKGVGLPDDWETATLGIPRIIELLRYPRICHLDTALSAFGHPSQETCVISDPAVAGLLEAGAAPWRNKLQRQSNEGEAQRLVPTKMIPDRWWRAVIFYRAARKASGDAAVGPKWPEPYEYLGAPREDIYTPEGWSLVVQLSAIVDIVGALHATPDDKWDNVLEDVERRGGVYAQWTKVAREPGSLTSRARLMISSWASRWEGRALPEMLPGFVD